MVRQPITIPSILGRKKSGKKLVALTGYDYSFARILDTTEIDIVLVGDSLGMVSLGYENTLPVTMDEMVAHTRAVKRGLNNPLLVSDMPFMSYQVSVEQAVANAGRLIQEGRAEAVKLEGGIPVCEKVQAIDQAGVPVMGHVGLTPQRVHQFGGYKVQGKNYIDARQIKQDAKALQQAGVFSVVLEGIPGELAGEITRELKIPTIGIGAGKDCDGQILVIHDMLGLNSEFTPKFVKQYAKLESQIQSAVADYIQEVRSGDFPGEEQTYSTERKSLRKVDRNECS
ncbi:MAG: 3-methyl-2-oxobutanoate hydroxymethyltransferase [Nitrospinota bacterium]|nr:3-methyl-2-oxobutanoate hydroxymethyltransferase [Nitrospinota bacterium]